MWTKFKNIKICYEFTTLLSVLYSTLNKILLVFIERNSKPDQNGLENHDTDCWERHKKYFPLVKN